MLLLLNITLRDRVVFEKLTRPRLVKKSPAFYVTFRTINVFAISWHLFNPEPAEYWPCSPIYFCITQNNIVLSAPAGRTRVHQIPVGAKHFSSFRKRPERLWGPHSLLLNKYRDFFIWEKAVGASYWPPISCCRPDEEWLAPYLHSLYVTSWRVVAKCYLLTVSFRFPQLMPGRNFLPFMHYDQPITSTLILLT
jgi:hypothetical protein